MLLTYKEFRMLDDFQENNEQNKNGEFLDEFRQRLNSQPIENFEERKNDINRSQHIFLGTVLGIGLAGVASWFILSPQYASAPNAEIPTIRRPHTAVKVQPSEPGGMEILNQDKTVYDIVEKNDNPTIKVENLLPPPEEPKLPTIENNAEINKEIAQADSVINDAQKIIDMEVAKQTTTKQPEIKEEVKVEIKEVATSASVAEPQATKAVATAPIAPAQAPQKTEEIKQIAATPAETPSSEIAAGSWQIQLISSPNKTAIDKAWVGLTKKYNGLKNLPHEIESADLGAKGIFYRLKAGAFKTRTEAERLCNSIKSSGGSCLVKRK